MKRTLPKRSAQAASGGYSSFFRQSGSSSPESSSSSSTSSAAPSPDPTPSPPRPAPLTNAATQVSKAISDEFAQVLEDLFVRTPARSLKQVDKATRALIDERFANEASDTTFRKWWIARQWIERRKDKALSETTDSPSTVASTTSRPSTSAGRASTSASSVPSPELPLKQAKRRKTDSPLARVSTTEPARRRRPSQPLVDVPHEGLSLAELTSGVTGEIRAGNYVQPAPLPLAPIYPSQPASRRASLAEPLPVLLDQSAPWHEPPTAVSSTSDPVVRLPAAALFIGDWTRTSVVDPNELEVAFSPDSDCFTFSTKHLEFTYHLHLPLSSVTSLSLFHSLVYSRSILLIEHNLFDPTCKPYFTLTTSSGAPSIASVYGSTEPDQTSGTDHQATSDFTPDSVASTCPIYAVELEGTSLLVPLLLNMLQQHDRSQRQVNAGAPAEPPALAESTRPLSSQFWMGPFDPETTSTQDLVRAVMRHRPTQYEALLNERAFKIDRRPETESAEDGFIETRESVWVRRLAKAS
ncbi:hypothetical protein JCM10212_003887 [Sporobolomyces blumeae]